MNNKWIPDYNLSDIKVTVGKITSYLNKLKNFQIFIGADGMEVLGGVGKHKTKMLQWTNSFHPAEIIIHYKWNRTNVRDNHNTRYLRKGEPNRVIFGWK